MSKENAKTEDQPESVDIKLNFRIPARMPTVYAHHIVVQPSEHEVTISFFEVIPPLVLGDMKDEHLKFLQDAGITAECVARITVAKPRFAGFASAMQQVFEKMSSQTQEEKTDAELGGDNQENK